MICAWLLEKASLLLGEAWEVGRAALEAGGGVAGKVKEEPSRGR